MREEPLYAAQVLTNTILAKNTLDWMTMDSELPVMLQRGRRQLRRMNLRQVCELRSSGKALGPALKSIKPIKNAG